MVRKRPAQEARSWSIYPGGKGGRKLRAGEPGPRALHGAGTLCGPAAQGALETRARGPPSSALKRRVNIKENLPCPSLT